MDGEGRRPVDGQDLGPATAMVSSDGEYEGFRTIAGRDVARLLSFWAAPPATTSST